MKAIILAGGFGTRLRKIVFDRPKSMAIITGIPFLEHQIRLLKEQGVTDIILCVSFMADKIKSYFGNGKKIGVNISYSEEEIPLGTAGAIKKTEKYINDTFLVLNGDSYSHIDLKKFLEFHKSHGSGFSVAVTKVKDQLNYGGVIMDDNKIVKFVEKQADSGNLVNSGVYLFDKILFNHILAEKNVSLERETFPMLATEGLLRGYLFDGYFMDIGRPETYTKFKEDALNSLCLKERNTIKESLQKMDKSGIKLILVVDQNKKLVGTLNDREISQFVIMGGNVNSEIWQAMNRSPVTAKQDLDKDEINKLFELGIEYIPRLDEQGVLKDVEFKEEKVETKSFPLIRGRAPFRISFAGGGTDLPYFFEKHGGAIISATINKYCHATLIKRADQKIIINSDIEDEIIAESLDDLEYNGKLDLIKACIKLMNPHFGFELYIHNDIPPKRGLGSSATLSVLIISLLNTLMDTKYNDYKIAELAYKAEREELKIKGGWQDQYATVTGGFNYMEFSSEKALVYPLRLKEEVIKELESHLLLCYIGKTHDSGEIHANQEKSFHDIQDTELKLNKLKKIALDIREVILTNNLEMIGRYLNDAWEIKRSLDKSISNDKVDLLYSVALKNGAYGGKLLGAGGGGYLLLYHSPKKRNQLVKALEISGGEVTHFSFEFDGTKTWESKHRF